MNVKLAGINSAHFKKTTASLDVVVVSPLNRSIETGLIATADLSVPLALTRKSSPALPDMEGSDMQSIFNSIHLPLSLQPWF